MRRSILIGCTAFFLLGAGCARQPMPYVAGEVPTEEQLVYMSEEEKKAGILAFLQKFPPQEVTQDIKQAEANKAREEVAHGIPERVARFESRGFVTEGMVRLVNTNGVYSLVLSDDFFVEAGPSLEVRVSPHANPSTNDDLRASGDLTLGSLIATNGGQSYQLPEGTDIQTVNSIIIFSKPFQKIFAVASVQ